MKELLTVLKKVLWKLKDGEQWNGALFRLFNSVDFQFKVNPSLKESSLCQVFSHFHEVACSKLAGQLQPSPGFFKVF